MHPDLEEMIDLVLADGKITEKEREVIFRKAAKLGVEKDEVEVFLEGKLFQLQQQEKEGEKQTNFACLNCGSSIPRSSIKCAFCGFEISKTSVTGKNFIEKLNQQFDEVDKRQWQSEAQVVSGLDKWLGGGAIKAHQVTITAAQQKASIISMFNMPNDKEHLVEFFLFCDSNADAHSNTKTGITIYGHNEAAPVNKVLGPAWAGKAKLGYNKLKKFANEDEEIRELIDRYKKKYHQDSEDMEAISINKNQGGGKAVFFGLNQTGVILFIVLLFLCFPMFWLPFVLPACKAG